MIKEKVSTGIVDGIRCEIIRYEIRLFRWKWVLWTEVFPLEDTPPREFFKDWKDSDIEEMLLYMEWLERIKSRGLTDEEFDKIMNEKFKK